MKGLLKEVSSVLVGILVVLALIGVFLSYTQVPTGSVGVEKKWGATTGDSYQPGPHFIRPFAENVVKLSVRPQSYTMSATEGEGEKKGNDAVEVLTQNGVEVEVDITVRYRLNQDQAVKFYQQWRSLSQVEQRLIRPTVRAQLRTRGGAIPTSEIYTASGQEKLRASVTKVLNEELNGEALVLEEVQIRRIHLPDEYQKAVNEKEIRKQEVQKKQYAIEESKKEAERKRIEAEGDADANRIRSQSLTERVLVQNYIEALKRTDTVYVPVGQESGLPTYLDVNSTSGPADSGTVNATNATASG